MDNILDIIINDIIKTKKNSNSYLLSGNDEKYLLNQAIQLAKVLIIKENNYENNIISKQIKNNVYPELKIIDNGYKSIKKDEIIDIIKFNSNEAMLGKNSVYIINNAENLTDSAGNSLLKFLEEPTSNVVAIFISTNLNKVLSTIRSRSKIIKINNNKLKIEQCLNLTEEEKRYLMVFLKKIEKNEVEIKTNLKEKIVKKFDNKEKIKNILQYFLLIYNSMLYYKLDIKESYIILDEDFIDIVNKKTVNELTQKISYTLTNMIKLNYNVNILLFVSNYLIGLGDIV